MTMVTQVEVVNQSYVIILENIQNLQAEQNQESLGTENQRLEVVSDGRDNKV